MYSPTSRHHAETPRSCLCRQVRLMTTGGGSVHFNPNLYSCGKVCLSILGTWSGPAWTPVQNLTSVLLSIQSLLSTDPYYNEPGVPRNVVASEQYSDYVRHETMRVAVLDMVGDTSLARSMPPKLLSVARSLFIAHFPVYRDTCEEHAKRNPEGAAFADPLGRTTGTFCWRGLGSRLAAVGSRLGAANFEPDAERSERDAEGEGGGQGGSGSPSGGSGGGSSSPDECRVSQDSDVAAQTAAAAAAAADADATAAAVAAAAAAAATAAAAAAAAKAPVTSPKWACRTAAAAGVSAGIDGTVRRAIDGFADAVAEVPLNEGRALLGSTLAMMALLAVV